MAAKVMAEPKALSETHVEADASTDEKKYADAEYRRFLKEKDKYVDFDEFCRQEGI